MAARLWYPIFLDLEGKPALVVGGGPVALRKVRGLLEAGAKVTVVAPEFAPGFQGLPVERVSRAFVDEDLAGAALVFAATNSREVNRRIGRLARARGIAANIADAAGECSFIVPARLEHEGVQVAISTGGADPRRAARLRKRLERWLKSACDHEVIE